MNSWDIGTHTRTHYKFSQRTSSTVDIRQSRIRKHVAVVRITGLIAVLTIGGQTVLEQFPFVDMELSFKDADGRFQRLHEAMGGWQSMVWFSRPGAL
jgi:hypothetical protein